ncbi:MAG: hypothetical protein VB050_10660 [Geobacteraceae bacterium]|nr:hypothetical protein [Geobacteraceae bacterium]
MFDFLLGQGSFSRLLFHCRYGAGYPYFGEVIDESVGALLAAPGLEPTVKKGAASGAPTLGGIIRAFKSLSAIGVNRLLERQEQPLWQRNYFERVLRGQPELDAARRYILENPLR